jgi:hypothetical protein
MRNITIEKYYLDLSVKKKEKEKDDSKEYGISRITRERLDSIISNNSKLDKNEKMNFETEENEASGENSIN